MLGAIKAIETFYDGYRFRSRLEARWAVFFNMAKISYQYEPEAFRTAQIYDQNSSAYLPDFYLPKWDIYAEVKGTDEALRNDSGKIGDAIDFHATPIAEKGLLLLGNIPYNPGFFPLFHVLFWAKGVGRGYALFDMINGEAKLHTTGYRDFEPKGAINLFGIDPCQNNYGEPVPEGTSVNVGYLNPDIMPIELDPSAINSCFAIARSARFEHGERPEVVHG